MRYLLTAFEPFGGDTINSSIVGCEALLTRTLRFEIRFEVLPVSYGDDVAVVEAALNAFDADVILHTGEAAASRMLRLERRAMNVRTADAGGSGTAGMIRIIEGAPDELPSTLPNDALLDRFRDAGIDMRDSEDAGDYLCNHIMYQSLWREMNMTRPRRVGFMHVPWVKEQAGNLSWISPEVTADAIEVIMETLEELGPMPGYLPANP